MVHDSLPRDARSRYSSAYALWAMVERCRVPFMATVVGILDLDSWGADTLDAGSPRLLIWHYDRGACRARAEDCPMAPPTTGACSKSTDISARICALARTTNSTDDCRPGRNGTRESSRCIAIQRDCFRSLPINIGAANALPALSIARPIWKIRYTRYLEAAKIAAARFVFAPVV